MPSQNRLPTTHEADHPAKPEVLVVYHHFAHYRGPILRELIASERYHYIFAGDRSDPLDGSVKTFTDIPEDRFIYTPWFKIKGLMFWQRNLVRHMLGRRFKQIIFLGNVPFPSNWFMLLAGRLTGKHILIWTHGWLTEPHGIKKLLYKLFYKMGDGLLVYEHNSKNIGIGQGFKPESIYVVYNSLDHPEQVKARNAVTPQQVAELRERMFPDNADPIVMLTGRMIERRRFEQAIDAAKLLQDRGHRVNLLFVGDGPAVEGYRQHSASAGVNAFFYGACYDEPTLALLYACAACTLNPGPLGLVAVHTMVYGRPMLASDCIPEQSPEWAIISPGRNGDLFANNDVASIADTLERWTRTREVPADVAKACMDSVERAYNPAAQRVVFEHALDGKPADDLLLSRRLQQITQKSGVNEHV